MNIQKLLISAILLLAVTLAALSVVYFMKLGTSPGVDPSPKSGNPITPVVTQNTQQTLVAGQPASERPGSTETEIAPLDLNEEPLFIRFDGAALSVPEIRVKRQQIISIFNAGTQVLTISSPDISLPGDRLSIQPNEDAAFSYPLAGEYTIQLNTLSVPLIVQE